MEKLKNFNPMALREKYSVGSLKNNYSSFWLDNGWDNNSSIFDDEEKKKGVDLVALASYRRAISNFVSIVTGKTDIKVTFKTSGDSYTDGKEVTISSKLDDKLFDSTVGLALHEGSHILLSDFDFLKGLRGSTPKEYFHRAETKGYSESESLGHIKNLLNYVEDRRIDYFVFTNSPGYKGYYHSMYDKYFHSKVIDKALKTDEMTSSDWDSYIFRIINLTNKNSDLDSVPGLRDIHTLIFKTNGGIKNLKSTEDAFKIALDIYDTILNNLPDGIENVDDDTGEVSYKKPDGDSGESIDGGNGEADTKKLSDEEFKDLLDDVKNDNVGEGTKVNSGDKKIELTESQKRQLENAIKKQKKFMEGDIPKKQLSKKDKSSMDAVESAGMKYVDVANNVMDRYYGKKTPTKVLMVKKFTKALAESDTISMIYRPDYSYGRIDEYQEAINKGLAMGTILGKKLQVRGESRETKWSRKDSGRIDKRLIAELGFGNERVFTTTFNDSYADAHLHISIDASGSMGGDKWDSTMKATIAICKAASMIEGLTVDVSVRYTTYSRGRGRNRSEMPAIVMAYDSRKNKMSHIKKYFKYMRVCGTTPEGLCYQAIMDKISSGSNDKESYFLNFSDGMPMFSNATIRYYSTQAVKHTKKMMKEIRNKGVSVLSYYIGGDYERSSNSEDFISMYGSDAKFIDVTSVGAVAKTMNKKFLAK